MRATAGEENDARRLSEPVQWLYDLQHFGVKLGLENIRTLLEILGHPEASFPTILIAGTNGKGSVAAMIHAMLCAHGLRAGLFTSPHLVRPTERIRIGRDDMTAAEFDRVLVRIRERLRDGLESGAMEVHPSFFEVITASALVSFHERCVEAAVLEVGLGGRLDATNAVEAEIAVIVSLDLDHTKTLGPTLAEIAGEKAGIIKRGRPLISGVVRQRGITVLQQVCRERDARWIDGRVAVRLTREDRDGFDLETDRARYPSLRLSLPGRHQIDNARVAVAALECFMDRSGHDPDPRAVAEGLESVRWPGRLQWIRGQAGAPDLLLDGAHNPAGAKSLATYLKGHRPAPVGLFGVMTGKLLPATLETIGPSIDTLVLTRPGVRRAADPSEVAVEARRWVRRVEVVDDPGQAFELACRLAGDERFVLVTGSLYLVGEILDLLEGRTAPGPVSM